MEETKEERRKAMKDYTSHKVIFSIIGGFMLGGWDNLMAFLVMLVVADTISGVFKAIKTKTLSSEAMRVGLFKKAMIVLIVGIAVQADKVVLDYCGHPILLHFDGKDYELYVRTAFILWFCLEEAISLLENTAQLGLPIPNWLKAILVAIDNGIQSTTPSQIVELLEKSFKSKIGAGTIANEEGTDTEHNPEADKTDKTEAEKPKEEDGAALEDSGNDNTSLDK